MFFFVFYHGATAPSGTRPPHYRGFTITLRHTAPGRTPLDEWPARRRDLYLTTHITYKRQTFLLPAGFEPTIIASERPQTHSLDRAATGIFCSPFTVCYITMVSIVNLHSLGDEWMNEYGALAQ